MRNAILVSLLTLAACTDAVEVPVYRSAGPQDELDPALESCVDEILEDLITTFEEDGEVPEVTLLDCPLLPRTLPTVSCYTSNTAWGNVSKGLLGTSLAGSKQYQCCVNKKCKSTPCGGWNDPVCPK